MKARRFRSAFGAFLLGILASCSASKYDVVKINGHVFEIPKGYLLSGSLPWLPASQLDAIKFVLNPDMQMKQQEIVTVEPRAVACALEKVKASQLLRIACNKETPWSNSVVNGVTPVSLIRKSVDGSSTQWEYVLVDANQNGVVVPVVSCFSMENADKTGLCVLLDSYDDLIYSARFTESAVSQERQIRGDVSRMLRAWERKPN